MRYSALFALLKTDLAADFKLCSETLLIKSEPIARKLLVAMHLVPSGPRAYPPCPCPTRLRRARRPQKFPSFTLRVRLRDAIGRRRKRKTG